MGNYFEPVLSEEQMAAYLDGMLSTEESSMIEDLIGSNPEMVEIQETIDSVDTTYLYVINDEIPIECLADDFSLPNIGHGEDHHSVVSYDTEDYNDSDNHEDYDNQDNTYDTDYEDESSDDVHDDSFLEVGYNDISF